MISIIKEVLGWFVIGAIFSFAMAMVVPIVIVSICVFIAGIPIFIICLIYYLIVIVPEEDKVVKEHGEYLDKLYSGEADNDG